MLSDSSDLLQRDSNRQGDQPANNNNNLYGSASSPEPHNNHDDDDDNESESCCRRDNWKFIFFVLFLLGALVCGSLLIALPSIVDAVVRDMVAIKSPASPIFKFWLNPDAHGVKTHRKFWLYNITNPVETVLHGESPNVVVRGPFAYREVWIKDRKSVRWYMNGTIGYKYEYRMFFDPELSVDSVTGEQLSEDEVITLPNGPLRGTMYRVGRLPTVVVEDNIPNATLPNITQPMVCMLLDMLVNGTALGPKGILVQRPVKEVVWGYVDPLWNELHTLLGLFSYNASNFFQAQWNGSAVVPSPYTFRSGQMCPLWQTPSQCNRSGYMVTLEVSGRSGEDEVVTPMLPEDEQLVAEDEKLQAALPEWMRRPGRLLDGQTTTAEIVRYAGQLQGQWWWGPERDGMTGGSEPYPNVPMAAVRNTPFRGWEGTEKQQQQQQQSTLGDIESVPGMAKKEDSSSLSGAGGGGGEESVLKSFMDSLVPQKQQHQLASELIIKSSPSSSSSTPVPEAACHRQYGTDGTRFPLPIKKGSTLNIFNDMMGRTFPFTYAKSTTTEGLDTLRFTMDAEKGMSDSDINRYCFHQRFNGLVNVSQFVFGDGLVSKGWYLDSCVLSSPPSNTSSSSTCYSGCVDKKWRPSSNARDSTYEMPTAGQYEDGFTGSHLPFNITLSVRNDESNGQRRYSFEEYMVKTLGDPLGSKGDKFRERYDSYADVFPLTGNTMRASAVGMISLALGPGSIRGCNTLKANWTQLSNYTRLVNMTEAHFLSLTNFTSKMPRTLMPYLQLERSAQIGGEVLSILKSKLALVTAAKITLGVCCALSVVAALVLGLLILRERRQRGYGHVDGARPVSEYDIVSDSAAAQD